jgi:hypothetical protein
MHICNIHRKKGTVGFILLLFRYPFKSIFASCLFAAPPNKRFFFQQSSSVRVCGPQKVPICFLKQNLLITSFSLNEIRAKVALSGKMRGYARKTAAEMKKNAGLTTKNYTYYLHVLEIQCNGTFAAPSVL